MVKPVKILLLFLFLLGSTLHAQDLHFTQFYNNTQLLNPAAMGMDNTEFSAGLNHRIQWPEIIYPITTSALYAQKAVYTQKRVFQVGMMLTQDQFQGFQYRSTGLMLSGATHQTIGKNEFRLGLQGGLVFNQVDMSRLSFPNQWQYDQGSYNTALNSGEFSDLEALRYADFTLGVAWQRKLQKINLKAGASFRHLNRPNVSYYTNADSRLNVSTSIFFMPEWKATDQFSITPLILYRQTTAVNQTLVGNRFGFSFRDSDYQLNLGFLYRHGFNRNRDALISSVGLGYKNFYLELSNDFNVSKLSAMGDAKSTLEFSLLYTLRQLNSPLNLVPCERL